MASAPCSTPKVRNDPKCSDIKMALKPTTGMLAAGNHVLCIHPPKCFLGNKFGNQSPGVQQLLLFEEHIGFAFQARLRMRQDKPLYLAERLVFHSEIILG